MFSNQVVWITGASSGIGEALARQFAHAGARLVLSARRVDELRRVRDACEENGADASSLLVLPLDVTDHESMPAAVQKVVERFGAIDMLINNAGISQRSLCMDTGMDVYRHLFEVDVFGPIALTRAVLPSMLERRAGHIAIVSSVAGKIGVPYRTGYCAAKHAVMGFYDALRAEVCHYGLKVTTITPGFIKTHISERALTGNGSEYGVMDDDIAGGMDANRCAEDIMAGLRKGKKEIPVGEGMEMKALWLKRLFPALVFRRVARLARPQG